MQRLIVFLGGRLAKWRFCHHSENFEKNICGGHGGKFCVGVISRRNLYKVRRHDVQSVQTADDRTQLASTPPARLRRACSRRECWVDRININGKVDGIGADCFAYLFYYAVYANSINFTSLYAIKSCAVVIVVVCRTGECRADCTMLKNKLGSKYS